EARITLPPDGTRMGFAEFSRRAGDFALAMALVFYRLEGDAIVEARIGIGGAEDRPRRIAEAESALIGHAADQDAIEAAADAVTDSLDPMEDHATDAAYRRELARTLCLRALMGAR
ncbi:MAG TPA: xanthine dehydrogenase family protein subunit M, partial [Alphaproteobacteria bacterium]|nr:xanthine dehydrogenase family protein subunit M [Alphaproteobacteria bacterium]